MNTTYPVHVDATLDRDLSRWLWLVKWVMVIPHYVVLAFLWLAFVVLSAVALVAIVATGRYPRSIFEFNVGVLRWTWRVAYYAFGAYGTDRYPPFTLADVPDYPAHLTVDYPEHLSRGLVLVKWWLLAIPHYLVVALLTGGGLYVAWDTAQGDGVEWSWGGGLIGLLALVAAVVLLFTGRYPQPVYDLLLGLNRWVLRVAAYAGLMTDEYPPFRLDMGGTDPSGTARVAVPAQPGAVAAPGTGRTGEWGAGRIVAVVSGAVAFLAAGGFLLAGTTLAVADTSLRNDGGFLMSPTRTLSSESYAIISEPLEISPTTTSDWVPRTLLGDVEVRARAEAGESVFLGVAPTDEVEAYLAGVEHQRLTGFDDGDGVLPEYSSVSGGAPAVSPAEAGIWEASATGAGEQELVWEAESGDWTVVLMDAGAGQGVTADVSVGATVPALTGIFIGLLVAGGFLLLVAIALVLAALHGTGGRHQSLPAQTVPDAQKGTEG